MAKITAMLLVLCLLVQLCGCSAIPKESKGKMPQVSTDFKEQTNPYTFSAAPSQTLGLSSQSAAAVLSVVENTQPVYAYSDLYQLDEVKRRLQFDASVKTHQFSALNSDGVLDGAHLAALVKANNEAFMATKPFGYQTVEDSYVRELCDFIVTVTNKVREMYPQMDWERVYCNLGDLKILYDVGMLSFAEVSSERILSISKNNTGIVLTLKGEDGFTRVLTHETMHILQLGCGCEQIENCSRRAGICLYWDDFTLNTADWTWMAEGSAERMMCRITGGEALTYQYKMDYLCSMTMSVLLRDSVPADRMETLCFYSDPELLFDAFGCQTQVQRDELLNMMITLQILQMQPKNFHIAYQEQTGVDLLSDSDAMDQFSYSLKPAICTTLAKEFYENLVPLLESGSLTCNDLFFLLNLFEGHLNPHLNYSNVSKAEINKPFVEAYQQLRRALFEALERDNPGLDLTALYAAYQITAGEETVLNAQLTVLPEEKRNFLKERAQWQAEQMGLGMKVPLES